MPVSNGMENTPINPSTFNAGLGEAFAAMAATAAEAEPAAEPTA